MKVSYAKTVYGQKEIEAVVKCLETGTQMGENSRLFESKVSALFGKKAGLYVNSGSSALFVGMESFRFPEGSEVITPALTFSTTVGSIVKAGLVPVFCDVGKRTLNIDVDQIESLITNKTVAILAPNLLGNIVEWNKVHEIAKLKNLKVIEDSADTLGGRLFDKSSGHWSDMSITSFYGSHIINCAGNGGMLCLNDPEQINEAKLLRSWGRSSSIFDEKSEAIENRFDVSLDGIEYDAKFVFERVGYNLEGNELGAAFGLVQLESLENNILTRQENFRKQKEFFSKFSEYFDTVEENPHQYTSFLAFPIFLKESAPFSRRDFQIFLEKKGVQTRVVFTGNINRQPGFVNIPKVVKEGGYPNADWVMKTGVLLACHHGLTTEMLSYLHESVEEFVSKF